MFLILTFTPKDRWSHRAATADVTSQRRDPLPACCRRWTPQITHEPADFLSVIRPASRPVRRSGLGKHLG